MKIITLAAAILFGTLGAKPLGTNKPRVVRRQPDYQFEANESAKINRWTGQPHEHKREIARNLRRIKVVLS